MGVTDSESVAKVDWDVVAVDQVRGTCTGLRPVAGVGPHVRGQLPGADRPAPGALLACATYSITFGADAGSISVT